MKAIELDTKMNDIMSNAWITIVDDGGKKITNIHIEGDCTIDELKKLIEAIEEFNDDE